MVTLQTHGTDMAAAEDGNPNNNERYQNRSNSNMFQMQHYGHMMHNRKCLIVCTQHAKVVVYLQH